MSPQPTPLPRTPEEKLSFAARHSGVATLGPADAAALLMRLAELEAMAQRARAMLDHQWPAWAEAAQVILGEDGS